MAKKRSQTKPVQEVRAGANPHERKNSSGRRIGNLLGCTCLLVFAISEELWIGTLACAIGFAIIYSIQVFHDKTAKWYASPYLYATAITLALAYAEYATGCLTNFMTLK